MLKERRSFATVHFARSGGSQAGSRFAITMILAVSAVLLVPALSPAAAHLPDAAVKIGRIKINQDAQFTTNTTVTLSMSARSPESGVAAMQFSNDGRVWSPVESFKTARQWRLDDGAYPPRMNTVLKTVYARFRYGNGKWSKAVTDSIILARSPADVPRIQEVWIVQKRPSDYSAAQPPGSRRNPHMVPSSDNEAAFDSLMHGLMTNYGTYYPAARGTNVPGSATNSVTLTLRLGPGVYETHGDSTKRGAALAWSPRNGWRVIGAGKHATTLKAVHWTQEFRSVVGHYSTVQQGIGNYHNFEISDLTIDANTHEGGDYQRRAGVCLNFTGNNAQVRRVRAKNAATTIEGFEVMHIEMHNFGAEEDGTHNVIVEDCDAVQPQVGNLYPSGLVSICGQYGPSGRMHYYHNVVVRNCYLDGAAHEGDTPVNRAQYSVWDRGRFGVGIGGSRNAVVEDNLIMDVVMGYYVDSVRTHDITLAGNHFRNVCFGFSIDLVNFSGRTNIVEDLCRFENNLVELDPRFFPRRDTWETRGRRYGFRTIASDKGPDLFTFNKLIIENNTFQFTDRATPEQYVEGFSASLQGVRAAQVRSNTFHGPFASLAWDNDNAYLERQADIMDPAKPPPLDHSANRTSAGSVLEEYPYVLDKTLGLRTVAAGDELAIAAPLIDGAPAAVATGAPYGGGISGAGGFRWRVNPADSGDYVISFYSNTNRGAQPRRMLVRALPTYPVEDDRWFAAGMAGYWRLNETDGVFLRDSSGNGIDLNVSGALGKGRIILGQEGAAPRGVGLDLVSTTNPSVALVINNTEPYLLPPMPNVYHSLVSSNTRPFHPFTIALWFKAESSTFRSSILLSMSGAFAVEMRPHSANPGLLGLRFGNTVNDVVVFTQTNITSDVWHHLAAVYTGASARLYVDGELAAEDTLGQMTGWTQPQWLYIGGGGAGWGGFNGGLDELVVWRRALSQGEVAWLHQAQGAGLDLPVKLIAPTSISTTSASTGGIALAWLDNASNESGYLVERSADGFTFTTLASLGRDATSFKDIPPVSGAYTYRVTATNSVWSSLPLASAAVQYDEVPDMAGAKGAYRGLFSSAERVHDQSGSCAVSLTASGSYTAAFRIGATSHSASGRFDTTGRANKAIPRFGKNPLIVAMRLATGPSGQRIIGTVSDGVWTADLLARRFDVHSITNPATMHVGRYTLVVPGSSGHGLPRGNGVGAATVTSGGRLACRGWLADNTALAQMTYLPSSGLWPLYAALYNGRGSVWGWIEFHGGDAMNDAQGSLSWIRPASPTAKSYYAGFTNMALIEVSRYTPPATPSTPVLNLTNAAMFFDGGNLPAPFTSQITLALPGNRLISADKRLSVSLTLTNGLFSGKVTPPGATRTSLVRGALFQKLNCAYGFAFGTNQSAEVFLDSSQPGN